MCWDNEKKPNSNRVADKDNWSCLSISFRWSSVHLGILAKLILLCLYTIVCGEGVVYVVFAKASIPSSCDDDTIPLANDCSIRPCELSTMHTAKIIGTILFVNDERWQNFPSMVLLPEMDPRLHKLIHVLYHNQPAPTIF
jgi:hypothetical protein